MESRLEIAPTFFVFIFPMKLRAWLCSSLQRQFPLGKSGGQRTLRLLAARGERVSFQVGYAVSHHTAADVSISVRASGGLRTWARRVGCVPMPHLNTDTPREEQDGVGHIPGFVPDPLFPETTARIAPNEVNAFWISVEVPRDPKARAGNVDIELSCGDERTRLRATIEISRVVLEPRRNFHVTHWFYADALCDWYRVEPWSEPFWKICEKYLRNCAEHGLDTILVPLFTPPTDGVKRPTQLLKIKIGGTGVLPVHKLRKKAQAGRLSHHIKNKYDFDWREVRRWIATAQQCGITHFEWTHLFSQWGVKHAIRIYEGHGLDERLLWKPETAATSPIYRNFLAQFLPAFHRFLVAENLLDKSFFHVSDEPHGEEHLANYRAARQVLRELAPWMRVMDALSEIQYAREQLTDIPVPSIRTAKHFVEMVAQASPPADHSKSKGGDGCATIPVWCYYCCGPRGKYLNRLLDTPLAKLRMGGALFYRFGFGGFLHWGYNYWYRSQTRELIDPFTVTDGCQWPGWAYGDTHVVYPGADGPIDSMRWEIFAESLQDYQLLQILGVPRDGTLLARLKDFDDYPKDARWIEAMRRSLLMM
jgi:hypothetical protein